MENSQKIPLTRRTYNKWVANETLEDFALRFTAKRARRWSVSRIANTALGTVSFLVLEAIGGSITLSYGFTNSLYAILIVCTFLFLTGLPITYYAAKYGVDIDLLTRGAGFGYIGSTISSLIYASFTFIFFALEAAIMSMAIHLLFDIPLPVTYIISSLIVIPLVTHGITMISRFQVWTQPLWIFLQILPFVFILQHDDVSLSEWINYQGITGQNSQGFNIYLFGGACAVLFSMVAQIGEQVDFLRFLPEKKKSIRRHWWAALIIAGPGWVIVGIVKLLAGSFLAYLALSKGLDAMLAVDPTHMYQVAFNYVTHSPEFALILAAVFVIVCQLKINVANAYAGSLAWSNFFSRITHYHPGRVVWVVFNVAIALLLMELGVYHALEQILQTYSALVLAWIGSIVADLVINKPLGLSPRHIEFKRSHLYDINPVGVGSMALASVLGILAHLNTFGDLAMALSPFIALFLPFITVPVIAWLTRSKYYLVNRDHHELPAGETLTCSICEHAFDQEDMTSCPAYGDIICSLCCSLDSRCGDQCRPEARLTVQLSRAVQTILPGYTPDKINPTLAHFFIVFICVSAVVSGLLALVYFQIPFSNISDQQFVSSILIKAFLLLLIVFGVLTWLYVLSQQSRSNALRESQQQTQLLVDEITAHEKTYKELQKAKETAESANHAKSRYLTGISHELRTPLNVVLGYAQILENSKELPDKHRQSIHLVRRNSEHLTDLIEGLLEISKIEAGRLELQKDEVRITALLDQIVTMFKLQAQNKGLKFEYECSEFLPEFVFIDIKRLRQILFNLLSNAIKFTQKGTIYFKVSYRSQVAQFIVKDTGIGIDYADQIRIFEPFERVRNRATQQISGTGIGLAITRLLADLMGGEISMISSPDKGSTFTLSLMLSKIDKPLLPYNIPDKNIIAYEGPRKSILVVDDDHFHRKLLYDFLNTFDFNYLEADHAHACMELLENINIDLFLLDISMPDIDGWQLAETLRASGYHQPIIIISASHKEFKHIQLCEKLNIESIAKPVQLDLLLEKIGDLLKLDWVYSSQISLQSSTDSGTTTEKQPSLNQETIQMLSSLAEIGYLSALTEQLNDLKEKKIINALLFDELNVQLSACNFSEFIKIIDNKLSA